MPDPASLNDDHRVEQESQKDAPNGMLGMNPYILWGLLVVSCLLCGPIVFAYAPESWGIMRKLFGSVMIGALAHYCLFINRILVANW